jgi:uncharacterized protein with HEPN domain
MRPNERDKAYLWDMREAARDCEDFTRNATYDEFCTNRMMHSAVERRLEILGEAAGKISDPFQSLHPEIPWKEIKGIRLVLAHRYGDINLHELWQSVKRDLPDLITRLDVLMPPINDDDK